MINKIKLLCISLCVLTLSNIFPPMEACVTEKELCCGHDFIFEKCPPSLDMLWEVNSLLIKDAIMAHLKISAKEELDTLDTYLDNNANAIAKLFNPESSSEVAQFLKKENQLLIQYAVAFDQESLLSAKLLGTLIKVDQNFATLITQSQNLDSTVASKLQNSMTKRLEYIVIGCEAFCLGDYFKAYENFHAFKRESLKVGKYLLS